VVLRDDTEYLMWWLFTLGWLSAINAAAPNKNFANESLLPENAGIGLNPENVIKKIIKNRRILIRISCPFLPFWVLLNYLCANCVSPSNNG
jgi:hypothetical protein